jgi:hypothetical protein
MTNRNADQWNMQPKPILRRAIAALTLTIAGPLAPQAAELVISAPVLPPHVTDDGDGREAAIVRETLQQCGHEVTFETRFFGAHWKRYRQSDRMDAVTTVPPGMNLPGHTTDTYVRYQNGVSVLAKSGHDISELSDLRGLDIVTFENGLSILGIADKRDMFGSVREVADQEVHSRLLFGGRVDAVLSDGLIFAAHNRSLHEQGVEAYDVTQDVRFRAVVPPSKYVMAFRDKALRDDFDRCFDELKASGRVAEINETYIDRFRDTVGKQYLGY